MGEERGEGQEEVRTRKEVRKESKGSEIFISSDPIRITSPTKRVRALFLSLKV